MMKKIKNVFRLFTREMKVWWFVFGHTDTPYSVKILLLLAVAYAVLPFDINVDFIPVIGFADDAVIVPILLYLASKLTPGDILTASRKKAGIGGSSD